jgi:hypothetical protein
MVTLACRLAAYALLGIDPLKPNPDGADFHLMNAIDEELELDDELAAYLERCGGVLLP